MKYIAREGFKSIVMDKHPILSCNVYITNKAYDEFKRQKNNKRASNSYDGILHKKIYKIIRFKNTKKNNPQYKKEYRNRERKESKNIIKTYNRTSQCYCFIFHLIPLFQITNILPRFYKKINTSIKIQHKG